MDEFVKKINRRKTHSGLFKKGDPRINRKGGKPVPVHIEDIKNEVRTMLMEFFHRFFKSNYEDCVAVLNSKTLSVGETIALRFLLLSAGPNATPAHIQTVCKLFGLRIDPDNQVNIQNNINLSLEDMVIEANKPKLIETATMKPPLLDNKVSDATIVVEGVSHATKKEKA
jgi:hypothetical protein